MVVITGHSGAGKSEAIAAFEDGGYFCVDNLPPADDRLARRALPPFRQRRRARGGGLRRSRGRVLRGADPGPRRPRSDGLPLEVLYLEADEETLVDRYKETRRRHPLAPEGRIVEGIRAERELLAPLRERADVVMDTSDLTAR